MKRFTLLFLSIYLAFGVSAQQTLSVRISTADDDLEEYLPGTNQSKTPGAIDIGSSDLELGMETKDNIDPLLIGLRFAGLTIPKGAIITKAYLQFTVDNTNKNTDPCNLYIFAEETANSIAFNPNESFILSKRKRFADSISWNIRIGSWEAIGQKGQDQTSTDISPLIQKIVDQENWNAGNALSLFIKGTGLREAESFDGSPGDAPLLVIEFIPTLNLTQRVESAEDDLEEYLPGSNQTKTPGNVDVGSSDLELGMETKDNVDPQYVGIRFNKIAIPQGSKIKSAFIQFTVDNNNKNTDPCDLHIYMEHSLNSPSFNPNETFPLTKRTVFNDSVKWNVTPSSWAVIGEKTENQRTPDLKNLLQLAIDQNLWSEGNSVSFFIKGTGLREAESYDGSPADAPQLIVDFVPVVKSTFSVLSAEDDLEEYLPGANQSKTVGAMDVGSSDLELGTEAKDNVDPQLVGIRFNQIKLPKGTLVSKAYIQFAVDNNNKNTDPSNLTVWVEDIDQSPAFNPNEPFNLSKRILFLDSVVWNIKNGSWNVIGEKSLDQQSTDLSDLVNYILSKPNWKEGNAISFFIKGTGLREAESFDGSAIDAPKLVLEYFQSKKTPLAVGSYPLEKKSEWSYFESPNLPAADWNASNYSDDNWNYGAAPLGFGDPFIVTKLGFGPDPNNKYTTTYFRKFIQIDDISKLSDFIEFNLRVDDGAVVYVNGTEVIRYNMPVGVVNYDTKALLRILGQDEMHYFVYDVPKSAFLPGKNLIAVEVHQWGGISTDLNFDLEIKNRTSESNPSDLGCTPGNENHISCFTSLIPRVQGETIELPTSHRFQYIVGAKDPYVGQTGTFGTNFDFTGYVPLNGSSTRGHLSINHETEPGGVSVMEINYNPVSKSWEAGLSGAVDFGIVANTAANCSGTVTPWNTIITCEETTGWDSVDINADGYSDLGWAVEIDPVTRAVKNYGRGPEKLWALGRMSHENVVIASDRKTLYQGEDEGDGSVYKFIADKAEDLSKGKLYVLKLNGGLVGGEPSSSDGIWLEVPNTSVKERNEVKKWAIANGATTFAGVEDVEINPMNGEIYFAVKGFGRVYKFKDNGNTFTNFETFVGGKSYRVNSAGRVVSEDWGLGNDNLTFDNLGNLWVLQDGGSNHVWIVRPGHTQNKPKVEIFMLTPIGSEPTGMTFTPDFKHMFISIQEPSSANALTLKDAKNKDVKFNKSTCIVVSRNADLGVASKNLNEENLSMHIVPNPFNTRSNLEITIPEKGEFKYCIRNLEGKTIEESNEVLLQRGKYFIPIQLEESGLYLITVSINGQQKTLKLINQN